MYFVVVIIVDEKILESVLYIVSLVVSKTPFGKVLLSRHLIVWI